MLPEQISRDAGADKTGAGLMVQDATTEAQRSNWSFADDVRLVNVYAGHDDDIVTTYADDFELSTAAPVWLGPVDMTEAAAMVCSSWLRQHAQWCNHRSKR